MREMLYSYHQEYGYSPHSLIAISEDASGWEATRAHGAVAYLEVGHTWLAAEPLTAERDLSFVAREFLEYAAQRNCYPVFIPVTERFARAGLELGLDCVALGKSPYFNLATWKCEGRRLHTVRKELRKAARAGVTVTMVPGVDLCRIEVQRLERAWIETRRTSGFRWIFSPGTFRFPECQRHFLARNGNGELVGLLSAAPLPAREAFYFKDLHRHPQAPKGTADSLMVRAIHHLSGEGFRFATAGAVPLLEIERPEALGHGNYPVLIRLFRFLARRGGSFYNFSGLRTFKARFGPAWWEYEYALAPRTRFASWRVGLATARATMPEGVLRTLRKARS